MTNNVFWIKEQAQQQQNKQGKKIFCHSREPNPGPLAPQSGA